MQFFHLFSFVVVASYAAALPQPAGLSEKYSNNVDTNLVSGLEARSYQPGLNSQKNSATLTLLKRQDDSEESPEDATVGGSKVPENVKAAGAAVGGDAEKALVKYLDRVLHVSEELEKWVEVSGDNLDTVIKSGLSGEEYANVESSLKEAKDKLTADVSDNLQQVNAALSVIAETPGSAKQEMETVHAALGRVFDAYKVYFEVLKLSNG
ncbi:hypothetical protein BASA60_002780 [Batrachochytrium salamandrivorans]|nr:hypothetical protein BASA60_002780 [Batrachochytrium salamandrivorans]